MADLPVIDVQPNAPVSDAPVLAPGDSAVAEQERDPETGGEVEKPEGEETAAARELAALKKQLAKAEKRRDTIWAQRQEAREEARALKERMGLTTRPIGDTNHEEAADSDTVSLSRAELQQMIDREAKRLAPTVKEQQDAIESRKKVARTLLEDLGPDKYQELTDDLADLLPPDAQLLVLETDSPRALIEYLTDPEHEAETKAIGKLSAYQQGMKLGLLSAQLKAKRSRDKPMPSKAAAPIEPVKSQGDASRKPLALLDGDDFAKRRREQIAARHLR
jgi:hypothetical protein